MSDNVAPVTISAAEFDQYQQYEEWVLEYVNKNGMPCQDFRRRFPKFQAWYNENKNKAKRIAQQQKLDAKVATLLPLFEGLPNPAEAAKAVILAMAPGSTYSELLPKSPTPVDNNDDEDECDL